MRHAVIAPSRSETRLGLRRPVVSTGQPSSGRHAAFVEVDAPTVVIRLQRVAGRTVQARPDVFAGRDRIATRDGSGRSPREMWDTASPRRRLAVLAGAAVALVSLGLTSSHTSGGAGSTSSTTSAAAPSATTPLGCGVHDLDLGTGHSVTQTDDPLCTQKELASRLCDLELGDNPTVSAAGFLQTWTGTAGQASLLTTRTSQSFRCINYGAGSAHLMTFDDDEWGELLSPGTMSSSMSRRLANS